MIKRYQVPELEALWSQENKLKRWLKIEVAVLEFYSEKSLVSVETLEYLRKNLTVDLAKIQKLEEQVKHDLLAFLYSFKHLDPQHTKYLHFGLTSTDIVDTANSIALKQTNSVIKTAYFELLERVKILALSHKDTLCLARTHGKHAEVYTFGLKMLLFYDELSRWFENFEHSSVYVTSAKMSGATGTYAHIGTELQEFIARKFKLSSAKISTQVLPRSVHANYLNSFALLGSIINNFVLNMRLLAIEEINEIQEGFGEQQLGSSAMPHKKNPITFENISGMSRLLQAYSNVAQQNVALFFERDISHSSNERIMFLDAPSVVVYTLRKLKEVLENIQVQKEVMFKNLKESGVSVFSQGLVVKLVQKTNLSRLEAYEIVQQFFRLSTLKNQESLEKYFQNYLSKEEIQECVEYKNYLHHVDSIYSKVLE